MFLIILCKQTINFLCKEVLIHEIGLLPSIIISRDIIKKVSSKMLGFELLQFIKLSFSYVIF